MMLWGQRRGSVIIQIMCHLASYPFQHEDISVNRTGGHFPMHTAHPIVKLKELQLSRYDVNFRLCGGAEEKTHSCDKIRRILWTNPSVLSWCSFQKVCLICWTNWIHTCTYVHAPFSGFLFVLKMRSEVATDDWRKGLLQPKEENNNNSPVITLMGKSLQVTNILIIFLD